MGLTANSTGINAVDGGLDFSRSDSEKVIAVAGNPNVGKSTVFNALTGLNQHTGNWTGKTVCNASGRCSFEDRNFILVDIPGTYSLMSNSREEEVARDFICFDKPDAVIVVCDATVLERNLNLVLQTIEITPCVVVCVNLLDEAEKKKITIDIPALEKELGVPVVPCVAREERGLDELMKAVGRVCDSPPENTVGVRYSEASEEKIAELLPTVDEKTAGKLNPRWTAVKLLDGEENLVKSISEHIGENIDVEKIPDFSDEIIHSFVTEAERIAAKCVIFGQEDYYERDRKLDRILAGKRLGVPVMILMLLLVFWITITGANYPSAMLSDGLFALGELIRKGLTSLSAPDFLISLLIDGIYRVLAWVVAVMLPPMAIFFPLFTLLEDFGYLPRVAFNLDKYFKKACTCGKQALTMCMGENRMRSSSLLKSVNYPDRLTLFAP